MYKDVNGLNNNKPKVFVELPKVLDNIKMNEKGEFWVALNTRRLGETSNDGSDPIGVKYDGEGSILQELDRNGGTIFNSTSEVNKVKDNKSYLPEDAVGQIEDSESYFPKVAVE
ncbi:hypothetical protein Goshw_014076 [Gossypium schwendimanii]|uniref:Strictosidine synthase conserved region domain-containing protein n=1 Tax=Gossypium schwendimanii TaxID=34291 RepID=A0A7J9LFM9_GOSSC|nr:hypothetical protein [Gossypium schwendimanii]